MNPKQFINNGICYFIDSIKGLKLVLKIVGLLMYPDYPILPKIKIFKGKNLFNEIIKLYFFIFFLLFIIPFVWSYYNGQLLLDNNPASTNLLEDKANLLNYIFICELYVIIGFYILTGNKNLKQSLVKSGLSNIVNIENLDKKTKSSLGYFGVLLLFTATFIFSAGYAYDITNVTNTHYWFMESINPSVQYTRLGYYYFLINFVLLFFVLAVALSYFGFINKIGFISSQIKNDITNKQIEYLKDKWGDDNKLKRFLAPITKQMLLLQIMVAVITLNIVLWNINKQGIGFNYDVTIFILIVFGIWLFTLPRYYINYQIFTIWKKIGKHEYKNLSLPWLMGLSSIIDIILFTLLLNKLIDKDLGELFKNIIG